MDANGLILTWVSKSTGGTGTLTAKIGDQVVHMDDGNINKAGFRRKFVEAVSKDRPAIDKAKLDAEMLRLAADAASKVKEQPVPQTDEADLQIIRPERFIHRQISGLTIPERAIIDNRPTGRWVLYVQWADGRRERLDLPSYIELPDKGKLWIHPQPAEPLPTAMQGWSHSARQAWLTRAASPDAADVFKRVCERIAYFIDLPQEKAPGTTATLALWAMLTYIYTAFDAVPYLYVGGPLGSGKSRVFEILLRLVFRPLASSNLTAACLFRTLHQNGGTLLLDEAERLRESSPDVADINSMLLAGYKRGGRATRLEPVGDTFKTVEFDVYGPKAVACIAGLPPALASRCIPLTMFRSPPGSEKPKHRIDADPQVWQALRDELHALTLEHGLIWLDLPQRTDVCPIMSGRHFELWQPLMALAAWIESAGAQGLVQVVKNYALDTIEAGRDDQTPDTDEIILRIVADKVRAGEMFTPGDILAVAQNHEPTLFQRWAPKTVSNRLKQYGIPAPRKSTHGRRVFDKITSAMLQRIQNNYGIDLDFSPPTPPRVENSHDNSLQNKSLLPGGESGESGEEKGVTA